MLFREKDNNINQIKAQKSDGPTNITKDRVIAHMILQIKSSCLKWTYWRSGIDYRIASLFTRWLIFKEIIPK